jgi:hypothetical protein
MIYIDCTEKSLQDIALTDAGRVLSHTLTIIVRVVTCYVYQLVPYGLDVLVVLICDLSKIFIKFNETRIECKVSHERLYIYIYIYIYIEILKQERG